MKYIELFAGIGGFRLGLDRIPGFDSVWSNEWDKYAAGIYKYNWRAHTHGPIDIRDIRSVEASEIPGHDMLTAGFPCQPFSVSGKRGGFEDTRGTLFFEIARVLQHHRPGHILLENVQGLLSDEDGKTYQRILGVLSDLGYRCEWQLLDSKHFGVPQERKRVFIVGHLRGRCAGKILPIIGTGEKDVVEVLTKGMRTAQGAKIYDPSGSSVMITSGGGGLGAKTGLYVITKYRGNLKLQKENISTCIDANYWKGMDNRQQRTGIMEVTNIKIREDETIPTLLPSQRGIDTGRAGIMEVPIGGEIRVRRMMPVECERVQGFPDHHTKWGIIDGRQVPISDTQRYKGLGNAVTVNVIEAIGERMIQCS